MKNGAGGWEVLYGHGKGERAKPVWSDTILPPPDDPALRQASASFSVFHSLWMTVQFKMGCRSSGKPIRASPRLSEGFPVVAVLVDDGPFSSLLAMIIYTICIIYNLCF